MMRPNYKDFRRSQFVMVSDKHLEHSAKGSTWEEHKYIKRIDGTYYYPDSYEGGRHLPDSSERTDKILTMLENITGMKRESLNKLKDLGEGKGYDSKEYKDLLDVLSEGDEKQAENMTNILKRGSSPSIVLDSSDVEKLANETIRGNFGNGQQRKDLLGENYSQVQTRVNEIVKGSTGSKKVSEASSESIKTAEAVAEKASISTTKKKKKKEETKVHSGVDMNVVLGVYNKKKR